MERLDRFYVGDWASFLGGTVCIWPGTSMSDHSPVSLTIAFERPHPERRGSRIPDRLLSGTDISARIAEIWGADPTALDPDVPSTHADFLATCIKDSSASCRETTATCRREAAERESSLLAPLASVQRLLQAHPGDAFFAGRHAHLLEEIRVIQERRSEFSGHARAAGWIARGDRMNKDFFAAHRERPSGTALRAVLDDEGHLQTHPDRVLDIATTYYADLFSADPVTPDVQTARATVWSHTRRSVTDDMSRALCFGFSMQELRDEVEALDPASCPGDDGLTRQFFLTH